MSYPNSFFDIIYTSIKQTMPELHTPECVRRAIDKYQLVNKEKIREYKAKYYQANKEAIKAAKKLKYQERKTRVQLD